MLRISVVPVRLLLGFASMVSVLPIAVQAESVIYNSIPSPLPPNIPSLGYAATSTSEFGNLVNFATGTDRSLTGVTLVLSNFAYHSEYSTYGTDAGFNIPLTFNLYNVNADNSVGSLIATQTITQLVPWRPEPDGCSGTTYTGFNGSCYNGAASLVNFSFGVSVPDTIIYGLAYNTQNAGYAPTGTDGPYNMLNFGLSSTPPSVGTNGSAYINSSFYYGSGGPGVYSETNYAPYSGAVEFTAVPEPGSLFLMGIGLAFVAYTARKRLTA